MIVPMYPLGTTSIQEKALMPNTKIGKFAYIALIILLFGVASGIMGGL